MKAFHFAGHYKDEASLPQRDTSAATPFKEPEDMKKVSLVANGIALGTLIVFAVIYFLIRGIVPFNLIGLLLLLVSMVPHEFLHGIAMNGDVYMYENLKHGMLFVVSSDDMSKGQFIFMSLLPNLVFGVIPFIVSICFSSLDPHGILGTLGVLAIASGAGDYMNVFNAATQMPKGSVTFLSGMHSYWYMPEKND